MKTNNKMRATYMMFGFAVVLMNLSNVPGLNAEIGSTDLLSTGCDLAGDIEVNGESTCNVEKNKVRGTFTIKKVVKKIAVDAPATAKPTEEFQISTDLESEFCMTGTCGQKGSRNFKTLAEANTAAKKMADGLLSDASKSMKEEKERAAKVAKCEMTEDGEPITKEKHVLKCLTDKLAGLNGDEAADFYGDNLRERLQDLLKSQSSGDRELAMEALQGVGKAQKVNCAARPGMQQTQNPFLNQPNLSPVMNSMQPVNLAGTNKSKERNFVAESACDLWAFGTYNHNMEFLNFAAAQPGQNRAALVQAKNSLQAGWGTYFAQRGLTLKADPFGAGGHNGEMFADVMENNARMDAAFKAIVDQHKEFMPQVTQANDGSANTQNVSGRLARGGAPVAHNPTSTATAVNPWGTPAGVQPTQQIPRPTATPAQQGRVNGGAPRMGAPVGFAPAASAPLRR